MKLTPTRFRVLNYRNIDDSGWIPLERVTAFVGRNESGKTSLLKALHKFNPATPEKYSPQRDFPRDRFTAEYNGDQYWPVCRVEFDFSNEFQKELREKMKVGQVPIKATLTRYFDGSLKYEYDAELPNDLVDPNELVNALETFAKGARRLNAPAQDQNDEQMQALRTQLAGWADENKAVAGRHQDLRTEEGIALLEQLAHQSNELARPESAELIETLRSSIETLQKRAEIVSISQQLVPLHRGFDRLNSWIIAARAGAGVRRAPGESERVRGFGEGTPVAPG